MPTLDELTESDLRSLYLGGLTDAEIATRYQTYQVKISRLRAKYGIQTIIKSDRLSLPETFTERQRSLLIGSMLGDGNLRRTGTQSASLTEHHSAAQRAYLDWKVTEWGPFFNRTADSHKKVEGEVRYEGFRIYTHGCRAFFPFWQLFYPDGKGEKSCVGLDVAQVDDFALAVWFMDDGSRAGDYVRFSVSPDEANQRAQLRILRKFGLSGRLYVNQDQTNCAIHIQDRTNLNRFLEIVSPHVHESMRYKLAFESRPQAGPAPRHLLTREALEPLVERKMSASAIGAVLGTSRQSVLRALDRHGLTKSRPGRPSLDGVAEFTPSEADDQLSRLNRKSATFVDDVVGILSRTTPPLPSPSAEQIAHDVRLLRNAPTRVEGDTIVSVSKAGSVLCGRFFPHRWDARYREQPSLRQAWYDPGVIRQAVRFQMRVGDPVTAVRVYRAVQVIVRAPTNFRPCFAKALVEHFCPEGGLVLDPCAGYGGRAAGTLAAARRYVGVDPHPDAEVAHRALAHAMGADLGFHNTPFEDVSLGELRADMILTSPPYFSVERYSDVSTQSWVRYPTWVEWRDGFLKPFVDKCMGHLRSGRIMCVNTKDVRMGRQTAPIGSDLVRLAEAAGFTHEATMSLPIGRVGKNAQSEPIFIFRRP